MKFKEQRGNVFVFDVDGVELHITRIPVVEPYCEGLEHYEFRGVLMDNDAYICSDNINDLNFDDIKTAAQMMQILIDRGLV